jgi:Arc/MetJ family transcription regulator
MPTTREKRHKTSVEVDLELLNRARQALGTTTLKDTIERAFTEVLRERARRAEVDALTQMTGLDLADPSVTAKAWRR